MGTAGRKNDHQAVTGINKIKYNIIWLFAVHNVHAHLSKINTSIIPYQRSPAYTSYTANI